MKNTVILFLLLEIAFFVQPSYSGTNWKMDNNNNFVVKALSVNSTGSISPIGWTQDVRLSYNNHTVGYPKMSADGEGILHVVWGEHLSDGIYTYYKKSLDDGKTWTSDFLLFHSTGIVIGSTLLNMCFCSWDNTLCLYWTDNRDGNYEIYYKQSTDGGLTWGNETRLTNGDGDAKRLFLTYKDNSIHLFWSENRVSKYNDEIYYKRSTDGGLTWSDDIRLTNADHYSWDSCSALNNNVLHLVWADFRDSSGSLKDSELYYRYSEDNGTTWSNEVKLTSAPGVAYEPYLLAVNNILHLVWSDSKYSNNDTEIYYKNSKDNGKTWSEDKRLTFHQAGTLSPIMTSDQNGLHLVWSDYRNGSDIYYKKSIDEGETWGSDIRLTYNPSYSLPDSLISVNGILHLLFGDERIQPGADIYYKRFDPTAPVGKPGKPQADKVFKDTQSIHFYWNKGTVTDPESDLVAYHIQIGTQIGLSDLCDGEGTGFGITGTDLGNNTYYCRVRVKSEVGYYSDWSDWSDGIGINTPLQNTKIYPNPYRIGVDSTIVFSNLDVQEAVLKIYTITGDLVWQSSIKDGEKNIKWDGYNTLGGQVASGIYLYVLSSTSNKNIFVVRDKIAVIK
ncbi:MAG: exo-alpha-sialidase [Elusimicrobiota bacterium]